MATLKSATFPTSPIAYGATGLIHLDFGLGGANPDKSATVTITAPDGTVVGTGQVTLLGQPGETLPPVVIGTTAGAWSIQADQGTLTDRGVQGATGHDFAIAY